MSKQYKLKIKDNDIIERVLDPKIDIKEYNNLKLAAYILEKTSPNSHTYTVKNTYLDYGQDWSWTTIIDETAEAQILNPKEWKKLISANSTREVDEIVDEIKNDKYFLDKPNTIDYTKTSFTDADSEIVYATPCGSNKKYRVKPFYSYENLVTLEDMKGNTIKVLKGDLYEEYNLYDYLGNLIHSCDSEDDTEDYEHAKCSWCNEDYFKSDLKYEKDLGYICPHCKEAIESRGESLSFKDSNDKKSVKRIHRELMRGYYDSKKKIKDDSLNKSVNILKGVLPNLCKELDRLSEIFESKFKVRTEGYDEYTSIHLFDSNENYNYDSEYTTYEITGKYPDYEQRLTDAFIKDGGEYIEWENSVIMILVFNNEKLKNKVIDIIENY